MFPQHLIVMSVPCNLSGFSASLMKVGTTTVLVLVSPVQCKIISLILLPFPELPEYHREASFLSPASINPSSSKDRPPLCRCVTPFPSLLYSFLFCDLAWRCLKLTLSVWASLMQLSRGAWDCLHCCYLSACHLQISLSWFCIYFQSVNANTK